VTLTRGLGSKAPWRVMATRPASTFDTTKTTDNWSGERWWLRLGGACLTEINEDVKIWHQKIGKNESLTRTSTTYDIAQISLFPNWTSCVESSCLNKRNKLEKQRKTNHHSPERTREKQSSTDLSGGTKLHSPNGLEKT